MAKVFYPPACNAALLSAYRDEALDAVQHRTLESHLEVCPACRQELLHYEHLSVGLRRLALAPLPQPMSGATFRRAAAGPLQTRGPVRSTSVLVSAALTAVLILMMLMQRGPQRPFTMFEAYPPSGASNVSTDTSIVITFQQPVDQAKIQQTLQFEPQVPFDITWKSSQRAEVIPLTPLATSTTYTLLAAVPPLSSATMAPAQASPSPAAPRGAPPQTLTVFHTAPQSATEGGPTPVVPRKELLAQAQPASVSQAVLAVAATPSPVGLPSAAGTALAASLDRPTMLPPCAPANVFTPIYSGRGDIRTALGCVAGTTRTATLVSQNFQRGMLLAVLPDDMLYELTTDGLWRAAPLGAEAATTPAAAQAIGPTFRRYWLGHPDLVDSLGQPLSAEDAGQGLLQPFAHGFMLATPGWTYIADDAGQWQRLVSALPNAESTPSATGGAITGGVPSFPPLRLSAKRLVTTSIAAPTTPIVTATASPHTAVAAMHPPSRPATGP